MGKEWDEKLKKFQELTKNLKEEKKNLEFKNNNIIDKEKDMKFMKDLISDKNKPVNPVIEKKNEIKDSKEYSRLRTSKYLNKGVPPVLERESKEVIEDENKK